MTKVKSPTLLILEDRVEISEAYQEVLAGTYALICVPNGKQGLDMLEAGLRPDVILCDLHMPILNGERFLAKAREQNLIQCPVIITSSYISSENALPDIKADFYMNKLNLNEIKNQIEQLLSKAPSPPSKG